MKLIMLVILLSACVPVQRLGVVNTYPDNSIPVYTSGQCIGAQANGICNGSVIGMPSATCHGSMLNGQCIGVLMY